MSGSKQKAIVPAKEGRAFHVKKGQHFRLSTPHGGQGADFFAYNAQSVAEWLSPTHTWHLTRSLRPRAGDVFLTRFRRPIVRFVEDGAEGIHDMLLSACDQFRYELIGVTGPHASCSDNLMTAMRREGYEISTIPQPVNFFCNTNVRQDGTLEAPGNNVKAGAYVVLESLIDTICIVSSCPFDVVCDDWEINRDSRPTELEVEIV